MRCAYLRRVVCAVTTLILCAAGSAAAEIERPNVLFIAIDDLNDWVGPLGHKIAQTPNMDRLAARGVTFTNAHCQAPLCNPSRTSLMLSLRPTTTGVYALEPNWRSLTELKDRVPLTEHFKQNGYHTFTVGKLWHHMPQGADRQKEFSAVGGIGPHKSRPAQKFVHPPGDHPAMDWGPFPEQDSEHRDYQIAETMVKHLESKPQEPFFAVVGFALPHVPCFAPKKWFDLYPNDNSVLPPMPADDRADVPPFAWYLHWDLPEPRAKWLAENNELQPLARAYLASTSMMDAQIGRVLDALEASGRAERTIVVLWSDHGYHLGEKAISGKNTLWECSTRVPLIFAGPNVPKGVKCSRPAELMDMYPTLVEMCGLPERTGLEGHSLAPQIKDARAERPWPAITSQGPGNHAVRTERWRYIRYADGSEELYDCAADPHEWRNLAGEKEMAPVKATLAKWLPTNVARPAPGSRSRLVELKGGQVFWETRPVKPGAPVPQ